MKNALEEVQPDAVMAEHYFDQFQRMQQANQKKRSRRYFFWFLSAALLVGLSGAYYFNSTGSTTPAPGHNITNSTGAAIPVVTPTIEPRDVATTNVDTREKPQTTNHIPLVLKGQAPLLHSTPVADHAASQPVLAPKPDTMAVTRIDTIKKVQPKKEDTLFIVW
jgi:hypothetical protein